MRVMRVARGAQVGRLSAADDCLIRVDICLPAYASSDGSLIGAARKRHAIFI